MHHYFGAAFAKSSGFLPKLSWCGVVYAKAYSGFTISRLAWRTTPSEVDVSCYGGEETVRNRSTVEQHLRKPFEMAD